MTTDMQLGYIQERLQQALEALREARDALSDVVDGDIVPPPNVIDKARDAKRRAELVLSLRSEP